MKINFKKLEDKADYIRKQILKIVISKGGHLATSFSATDILITLYYSGILKFRSSNPNWVDRDRFILSKGHAETLMYTILSDLNFFPNKWLLNHYRDGKFLMGGHIDHKIPGIEFSAGSLGHGLGLATGVSFALKKNKKKSKVFVLLSDGECLEGSTWEAAIFASKRKLNNLIAIVDYNRISATDFIDNFSDVSNLKRKFKSFGWNSYSANGNSIKDVYSKIKKIMNNKSFRPNIIIAKTTKGKGLKFIENDPSRHTKGLDEQEIIKAKKIFNLQ